MHVQAQRWGYAAVLSFLLLYVFPYQARLNNPNENVRVYMTAAIVEHGTYRIDALRERWGWVNDAATRDGHVYSVKAPGTSWLGVPGYAAYLGITRLFDLGFDRTIALWACRFTGSIVPAWLWLMWLSSWLRRGSNDAWLRDTTLISIGFGSLLYGYALLFVSHTLSAAAAFTAFALIYDSAREEQPMTLRRAAWIGTLCAWVTVFEYPGLVASLVLVAYAWLVIGWRRPLLALAAGGAWPTLAMMHFQWSAFGSPLRPGHLMVENDAFRSAHEQGLYGAVGPSWSSLHGLLFDLGAGLFPLTPLLALAPLGFVMLARRGRVERTAMWVAVALCGLTLIAIASMNNWRGGWTIGPRYLAVVVPFMAWGALVALDHTLARWPLATRSTALACALAGCVASGLPSLYYPHLPPELTRPLPQLIGLLIAHDFAPLNAGGWLGVYGTSSMLPVALVLIGWLVWRLRAVGRDALPTLLLAAGLTLLLVMPLIARPATEVGVAEARAFITRRWTPPGHDLAAQLAAGVLRSAPNESGAEGRVRRLVEIYREEGRDTEAAATERRFLKSMTTPR